MTAAAPRQRRRGNGRSAAPPPNSYGRVRDYSLRDLVERLDDALDQIERSPRHMRGTLDPIASAIENAADILTHLRLYGRLP